eukprot:14825-Pelagococcus_subviridis.AAC.1
MQRARERERGTRVLEMDLTGGVVGGGGGDDDGSDSDAAADAAVADAARFEAELQALDLEVHVDLRSARRAAMNGTLASHELSLLKAILTISSYPRVAAPDRSNVDKAFDAGAGPGVPDRTRYQADARFHTRSTRDCVLHPTSSLNDPNHAPVGTEARPGRAGRSFLSAQPSVSTPDPDAFRLQQMTPFDSAPTTLGRHDAVVFVRRHPRARARVAPRVRERRVRRSRLADPHRPVADAARAHPRRRRELARRRVAPAPRAAVALTSTARADETR